MSDKIGIMICKGAHEPLKPGYARGFNCAICGKEVQISPTGKARVAELHILCTPCGLEMNERLTKAGKDVTHQFGPGAIETAMEWLMAKKK